MTLELSDYWLYSCWPEWLLAGWAFCGHFLAQTCTGLLVFSPVLEKMRAFIIAPRIRTVEKMREQVEDDRGSFSDLAEVEQQQYQYSLDEIDRIADELKADAEVMTLGSYKLCLIGVAVAVACMTTSLDVFAGPFTAVLVWPLIVLSARLRARAKKAKTDAREFYDFIVKIKENHTKNNTKSGLFTVSSLPSNPPVTRQTGRSQGRPCNGTTSKNSKKKASFRKEPR